MYTLTKDGKPMTVRALYKAEKRVPLLLTKEDLDAPMRARTLRGLRDLYEYHANKDWCLRAYGIEMVRHPR